MCKQSDQTVFETVANIACGCLPLSSYEPSPIIIYDRLVTARYRKCRYCHVMYKLLYHSIRIRTAPPVSVMVSVRVSVSFSLRILFCMCGSLR